MRPIPQFLRHDALLRNLALPPLVLRFMPMDSLSGFRRAQFFGFPPNDDAAISLIEQDVTHGRLRPALRSAFSRLRRSNTITVELDGDPLHGVTTDISLEDSSDRRRLFRIDLQPHAFNHRSAVAVGFGCALNRHAAISEYAAAGVQSPECELLNASESFLSQLLKIQAVDQAVHCDESLRLWCARIEALGHKDYANAGEFQALNDPERIVDSTGLCRRRGSR